jgi:hypothetical protein
MKFFVIFVSFVVGAASALASPENPTRAELRATVRHIQSIAREIQTDLDNEKAAHAEAINQTQVLQSQVNAITARANKAIADRAKILAKYHFLKLLASIIASAAAIMLVMQFGKFIPPPYNFYLMAGAGVGAATAVWIWL